MTSSANHESPSSPGDVTQILLDIRTGAMTAEALLPVIYRELRQMAAVRMAAEAPGQTLQPTALVHEAWLRLIRDRDQVWDSRGHFFAAAAEAMRRILVDNARHKRAAKHGGGHHRISLPEIADGEQHVDRHDILALDDALQAFAVEAPQKAELVKLRYFAGLSEADAAEMLEISRATAARWWTFSRAWLLDRMNS